MRGLVILGDSRAEVREVPVPALRDGWVRVKVVVGGVCGSDLHFYHSTPQELGPRVGQVIGHEAAGIVEAVGAGVTAVKPGDRVSVAHWFGCGHCRWCILGYPQFCNEGIGIAASGNGSSAEYVTAPERNCMPLPESLSFAAGACMACCVATAYSTLRKVEASGRHNLVVFGLGPVGLSVVMEAKAMGARVIGVEGIPERLALATELGADAVVDFTACDPLEAIRDLTFGRGADIAIETSGSTVGRAQLVEALGIQGRGVYIGMGREEPAIDPTPVIHGEKVLMGSYVLPITMYDDLATFLVERQVPVDAMVTHRFSIEQGVEAFTLFDTRHTGKVVFDFEA